MFSSWVRLLIWNTYQIIEFNRLLELSVCMLTVELKENMDRDNVPWSKLRNCFNSIQLSTPTSRKQWEVWKQLLEYDRTVTNDSLQSHSVKINIFKKYCHSLFKWTREFSEPVVWEIKTWTYFLKNPVFWYCDTIWTIGKTA